MLGFARIRPECIASCSRVGKVSWYLFTLGRAIAYHLCNGGRVINPYGCIVGTAITSGGAAHVDMVGSAEPTASRWSARPTRPSCRGRFGRSDHLDFVGLVGPSVPTLSAPPIRPYRHGMVGGGGSFSARITLISHTRHPFHNTPNQFINYCGVAVSAKNK